MKNVIALVAIAGVAGAASAQSSPVGGNVIAWWDSLGNDGNSADLPLTGADTNLTASAWTRSAGINPASASNTFSSNGWDDGTEADQYFSVTLDVAAGQTMNLTSLVIGLRRSNSGPNSINLRSSLDGFSSSLFAWDGTDGGFQNDVIDLSGLGGITGTVEFRITGAGATSSNGTLRIGDYSEFPEFWDLQFEGRIIPAPGAAALLGLGGLVATRRRRA